MSARTARRLAWSVWGLVIGILLADVVIGVANPSGGDPLGFRTHTATFLVFTIFLVTFSTVGAIVASRLPSNPIGWLLCGSAFCYAAGGATLLLDLVPATRTFGHWLGAWIWGVSFALTGTFVLLLFPTGRLPSPRWRPVAWIAAAGMVSHVLGSTFAPGRIPASTIQNPLGIGGAAGTVFRLLRGGFGVVLLAALASVVSLIARYRRAGWQERQQLKWLLYAACVIGVTLATAAPIERFAGSPAVATDIENALVSGALTFVPIAIGIAVLRYRVYDIDVVIRKTVVFGFLALFITGVYAVFVAGIGAAVGRRSPLLSFAAAVVVGVAFQPVRDRVRRLADRLVYGKRATPYEVLADFSEHAARAYSPGEVLPRMARIVAEGTGARMTRVWLRVGDLFVPSASWPAADDAPASVPAVDGTLPALPGGNAFPVAHGGSLLGAITVDASPAEPFTPAKEKLVHHVAAQAGLVLRNVQLIEDLRASRQRIVAAQDEERRRIERALRDGVDRQLLGVKETLRAAQAAATGESADRAEVAVRGLLTDTDDALENLRVLAGGVYPPLLTRRGLAAALDAQVKGAPVRAEIEAEGLGRYPQDIEAAVYFCALEALQNAAKYAQASRVRVRLAAGDGSITFEVADDGRGFDPAATAYGTGLLGITDRLEAVGGALDVRSAPGKGTTVVGRVPVAHTMAAAAPSGANG